MPSKNCSIPNGIFRVVKVVKFRGNNRWRGKESFKKTLILKKTIVKILQFIGFFALGAFIFWLIYKDQDIERIKTVLKNDVNYWWVVLSLFLGLLSHISRTLRWGLMIEPIGHKPRFINTFLAVMVGYLMNMAFPRMGEVSRCGVLSRYEKISFTKLVGTVVAERLIDLISLLILLAIVILSQFGEMLNFMKANPEISEKLHAAITSPYLIIGVVVFAVLIFAHGVRGIGPELVPQADIIRAIIWRQQSPQS